VLVAGDPQALEPGRPAAVEDAPDADLVVHRRRRRASPRNLISAGQGDDGEQEPDARRPQHQPAWR
jgi:hypothetical protein